MKTGNGKIANLPSEIRDELNRRINDGDVGHELVEWLNSKPEVVEVITKLFDGVPISEQNLSQWRIRGYRQWHAYHIVMQETAALAGNSGDVEETGIDCEKLLLALKANYAEMIQRWIITPTAQMDYRLEVFKHFTAAVLGMHRDELQKERIEIQRECLELQRERLELLREKQNNKSESTSEAAVPGTSGSRRPSGENASRRSSSPDSRSNERADAPSPKPAPQAPASAEPPAPAPKPPQPKPSPAANPSPPTAPTATTPPPKPKIPPYRDPRSRYSLR